MRRALIVVTLLLATAACGALDDVERSSGVIGEAPPRSAALFLGDSLTVGARQEGDLFDRANELGIDADILAQEGREVSWAVRFTLGRPSVPPVVVVALGTNPGADAESFATEVATLVDVLRSRGATTIAWVTPVHRDDRYDEKVEILKTAAAEGSLEIADWQAEVRDHPDWLIGDGLHYTDEGYAAFADFLATTAATLSNPP